MRISIYQLLALGLIFIFVPVPATETIGIFPEQKEIRVLATAHPDRFEGLLARLFGMPGYHLLVWEKGHAATHALFVTAASDSTLHDALVQIGAIPGNALGIDTWNERKNPDHPAPDKRISGSPIDLFVQWADRDPVPLIDLIHDPGGKGMDFRFGGHRANQAAWHSGCGVCLYSCPGSKVGNAAYTVRDYTQKTTQFRIRKDQFPARGTSVTLIFRLRE